MDIPPEDQIGGAILSLEEDRQRSALEGESRW
jgi:hypothetical protein